MSDLITVVPSDTKLAKEFKVSIAQAKAIVESGSGCWKGRKTVHLHSDRNIKVSWNVRQSGYAGPLVLQVST